VLPVVIDIVETMLGESYTAIELRKFLLANNSVNVKLYLFLTKYHAIKTYHVSN